MTRSALGRRSFLVGAGLLTAAPRASLAAAGKPKVAIKTTHGVIVVELEAQ